MPSAPVLELRGVSHYYNSQAVLQDIDFTLEPGQMKTVIGPNGSGKSTLLRLALGMMSTHVGDALLFGKKASTFKDWGRVGYVPQRSEKVPHPLIPSTVREVVSMGLYSGMDPLHMLRWRRRREDARRVDEELEGAGVAGLANMPFSQLSPGQQQRVMIARAQIKRPELLVLDEPDSAVDAGGKDDLNELLRATRQEQGTAVLLVSHDIGTVYRKKDSLCACLNCKMVYEGPGSGLSEEVLTGVYGHKMEMLEVVD